MLREGVAQWDGGALPSPECRETYKWRPEDAQRTLRGRSEALRGRSEDVQATLRGRSEDVQRRSGAFRGLLETPPPPPLGISSSKKKKKKK